MPLHLGPPTSILTRLIFTGRGISGTSNVQQTYIANKVPAMGCTFDPQQNIWPTTYVLVAVSEFSGPKWNSGSDLAMAENYINGETKEDTLVSFSYCINLPAIYF